MLERLRHMLIKEIIQIFRDPRMRFVLIVAPMFQVLVFGYATSTDVRNITTAIYDLDNSLESRELVARFAGSGYFDLVEYVSDDARARELIDRGDARALLRMNRGFGAALRGGREAEVQMLLDGTDSNTAGVILSYAAEIVNRFSEGVLLSGLEGSGTPATSMGSIRLQSRAWFNDNLESRYFYVPGVVALIVMVITLVLSSMAVVREKEIGTIEQIMVSPIRRSEFILGKTIPFALIGLLDVGLITLVAGLWFGVPFRGSLALLFLATLLYLMSTLGIGLLISTYSTTQQQAMMTAFFFNFPAVLLSGFMFPIRNMPELVQWLTYANPLRYFLVIVRGVFLKGVGVDVLWPQMVGLTVLGVLMLWFAVGRFQKTVA